MLLSRQLLYIFLTLFFVLEGCGFSPLYKKSYTNEYSSAELSKIKILPIGDIEGQKLRNFLQDQLHPKGLTEEKYYLKIDLNAPIKRQGVRTDETATRATITYTAQYQLIRAENQQELFSEQSRAISAYNILEHIYATVVSEEDAKERALKLLADDIALRIKIYFETK